MSMRINQDIQALRGVAVAMVLIQHLANRLPTSHHIHTLFSYVGFWGGVDIFFVISGFVITMSLKSEISAGADRISWGGFRKFWIRRVFRLLPASWLWLWIAVATAVFLEAAEPHEPMQMAKMAASAMLGVSNFFWADCVTSGVGGGVCLNSSIGGVYWSLSTEEQFYLALSVIVLLAGMRAFILAGIAAVAAYAVYCFYIFDGANLPYLPWSLRPYGLVAGVMLAWFWREEFATYMPTKVIRLIIVVLLVAAICFIPVWLPSVWAIPALSAGSLLVVMLALPDGAFSLSPALRSLIWLGERSYSLYLCHLPVFLLLREYLFRTLGLRC